MYEDRVAVDYIDTEWKPLPVVLGETKPDIKDENPCHTHAFGCTIESKSELDVVHVKQLLLPETIPKCPRQWDAVVWDSRAVGGNVRYHIFVPGSFSKRLNPPFVLKVSDKDSNGVWVYEDINFVSQEHLEGEMKEFKADMFKSLTKVLDREVPLAVAAYELDTKKTKDRLARLARTFRDRMALEDIRTACYTAGQS